AIGALRFGRSIPRQRGLSAGPHRPPGALRMTVLPGPPAAGGPMGASAPTKYSGNRKNSPGIRKNRIPGLKIMLPSRVEAPEEGVFGFPGHRAALGDAFYRRTAGRPGLAALLVLAAGIVGIGRGERFAADAGRDDLPGQLRAPELRPGLIEVLDLGGVVPLRRPGLLLRRFLRQNGLGFLDLLFGFDFFHCGLLLSEIYTTGDAPVGAA